MEEVQHRCTPLPERPDGHGTRVGLLDSSERGLCVECTVITNITNRTDGTNGIPDLYEGWNLEEYPSETTPELTEALASVDGRYDALRGFYDGGLRPTIPRYRQSSVISRTRGLITATGCT